MFAGIVGNQQAKNWLERGFTNNSLGNVLLFSGPEGIGKSLFAKALAKVVLKKEPSVHHPDFHEFHPIGKTARHTVEVMRHFTDLVFTPPYQAEKKVFILYEADRMLVESGNTLLKTLEEPLSTSLIILLTSALENVLPTLLSRARKIHFEPIPEKELEVFLEEQKGCDPTEARALARISEGSLKRALRLTTAEGKQRRKKLFDLLSSPTLGVYDAFQKKIKDISTLPAEENDEEENPALYFEENAEQLQQVLFWYRDLHLLQEGGNPGLLVNIDYVEDLKAAALVKKNATYQKAEEAVQRALDSLQRSTPMSTILETLLLTLSPT